MVIHLNDSRCIGCQYCVEVCPKGCFDYQSEINKARVIFPQSCLNCHACEINCEGNAIRIEKVVFRNFFSQLI